MRAIVISDTHGVRFDVPDADVLIHCGDFLGRGRIEELASFCAWLRDLPHKHKIVVAGNHDLAMVRQAKDARAMLRAHAIYLQDEAVEVEGVRFYGSPWTPDFFPEHWVFNQPRNSQITRDRWARIPDDTEVLITHGPPMGVLDRCPDLYDRGRWVHVGDELLRDRIPELSSLRLHCFGHIHEGRGSVTVDGVQYVNAAALDGRYEAYKPAWTEVGL